MNWAHAPLHRLDKQGTYMVTASTYHRAFHLASDERQSRFTKYLHQLADFYGWRLQAWAILSNHYHFVAISPENPASLKDFISTLHAESAKTWNQEDDSAGRQVLFQYWDTQLTYRESYLARLKYVHTNPVHHGVVDDAELCKWCSMRWLRENASTSFVRTVNSFKVDNLSVYDDF